MLQNPTSEWWTLYANLILLLKWKFSVLVSTAHLRTEPITAFTESNEGVSLFIRALPTVYSWTNKIGRGIPISNIGRPSNEENFMSLVLTANSFSIINEDDNGVTIIFETEREPYKFVGSLHEPRHFLQLIKISYQSGEILSPMRNNLQSWATKGPGSVPKSNPTYCTNLTKKWKYYSKRKKSSVQKKKTGGT